MSAHITIIAAIDDNNVICKDGDAAAYVQSVVDGAAALITDIDELSHRPGCVSILITNVPRVTYKYGAENTLKVLVDSLRGAVEWCTLSRVHSVYIAGTNALYRDAIQHPMCTRVVIARASADVRVSPLVMRVYGADVTSRMLAGGREQFPFDMISGDTYRLAYSRARVRGDGSGVGSGDAGGIVNVETYDYVNAEEAAVLSLISRARRMTVRNNRTQVPSRGGFGAHLEFSLHDNRGPVLPLLTSKRVAWKSVFHELVWFLRGDNDIQYLHANDVHIWDANAAPNGAVGAAYGHQWRHFGASVSADLSMRGCGGSGSGDGSGDGYDQIVGLVAGLRDDPHGRRHVVSAWCPGMTGSDSCVLPPCHVMFQMYVSDSDSSGVGNASVGAASTAGTAGAAGTPDRQLLSTMVTMRSSDLFIGLPFNIASYALLTHIVAEMCGYRAHKLVFSLGDYHIYENQYACIQTLLSRQPRRFPTLHLRDIPADVSQLHKITTDCVRIIDYYPHPAIKCDMVP